VVLWGSSSIFPSIHLSCHSSVWMLSMTIRVPGSAAKLSEKSFLTVM
jgi:hypothetical protein